MLQNDQTTEIIDIKPRTFSWLCWPSVPVCGVRLGLGSGRRRRGRGTYLDVQVVVVPLGQLDEDGEQREDGPCAEEGAL